MVNQVVNQVFLSHKAICSAQAEALARALDEATPGAGIFRSEDIVSGMDMSFWWSVHVPAGTPKPIVGKLHSWFNQFSKFGRDESIPIDLWRGAVAGFSCGGGRADGERKREMGRLRAYCQDRAPMNLGMRY